MAPGNAQTQSPARDRILNLFSTPTTDMHARNVTTADIRLPPR